MRIELERGGDLRPRAVEHGRGLAAEQLGEFFRAEREAVGGVHLPDEAERKAARRARRPVGWRAARPRNRGRVGARGLLGRGECDQQRHGRAGAEAEHGDGPGRDVAFGAAVERCLARELLGAERDQVELSPKRSLRRRHGLDQLAIGGKNRRRPLEIREQPLRAIGQAKVSAGAFGRNHQHGGRIVGQRDARAKTDQRAAEAGAETAQPFEPRRAALRQRAGQPRDLRGGRMLGFEAGWRQAPPGEAASKIAAAIGLAHRTRVASVLHSHTGDGLRAWAASRGSVRQVNWNSVPLIGSRRTVYG